MMWIEIVGWVGMVLLLSAFYLASSKRISDEQSLYHILNLLGAIGIGINAYYKHVIPQLMVEVAWACIATMGVANIIRRRYYGLG